MIRLPRVDCEMFEMELKVDRVNRLRVMKEGIVKDDRLTIGRIKAGMLRKKRCIARNHPYTDPQTTLKITIK